MIVRNPILRLELTRPGSGCWVRARPGKQVVRHIRFKARLQVQPCTAQDGTSAGTTDSLLHRDEATGLRTTPPGPLHLSDASIATELTEPSSAEDTTSTAEENPIAIEELLMWYDEQDKLYEALVAKNAKLFEVIEFFHQQAMFQLKAEVRADLLQQGSCYKDDMGNLVSLSSETHPPAKRTSDGRVLQLSHAAWQLLVPEVGRVYDEPSMKEITLEVMRAQQNAAEYRELFMWRYEMTPEEALAAEKSK